MYNRVIEYIKELYGNPDFVGLHEPRFVGNEKKYLNECVDSTFVSSVGKFVDRFEQMVEEYTGCAKAVACVNGTNALHLALVLSDVKAGDEVITQPLTFIATANAISYCGAEPVFLDVDRDTLGLSPKALKEFLSTKTEKKEGHVYNKISGRKIKAVVPMHTFGHAVRMDELKAICDEYGLALIEDAAESLGSFYKGQHTGTIGEIGVLSFNGNKTITTGGGGMLLFRDIETGLHAKHLTTQAKVPHRWEFVHDEIGYNYRMPNLNAALGCAQMENLPMFLEKKKDLAEKYSYFFGAAGIQFLQQPEHSDSNYWLNAVILGNAEERDKFLTQTNNNGVMTRPIWRLMNRLPMFSHCQTDNLENAIWLEERVVNIPSSVRL
ncbi:LegC family aminotransferase [Parabacteroides sp. FAFU027]|uniref:LegC family aminotransferase n=1 Tax=Parabacteroides sp. FAFU027 TaxID=2922715 RepID=UPI001FB0318F|nr:LegC family aminotransferase [Parabacteroides sp. FAFU027]